MKKNICIITLLLACFWSYGFAAKVTVKMNTRSYCMKLTKKATGETVSYDSPAQEKTNGTNTYVFNNLETGTYVIEAYGYASGTKYGDMGKLEITVGDEAEQTFNVGTLQLKANNAGWTYGSDYEARNLTIKDGQGNEMQATLGTTPTQNYAVCLIYLTGSTIDLDFVPSEAREAEGYETFHYSKTQTSAAPNETVTIAQPSFSVTVPSEAHFVMAFKPSYDDHSQPSSGQTGMAHYVPFTEVEPVSKQESGSNTVYTYRLQTDAYYSYRTWMDGKTTLAGRFTKKASAADNPTLNFTSNSYEAFSPSWTDHDVTHNNGLNVANIMLNINESGHLKMNVGDKRPLMAQRDWQITSNYTENYFLEPDYYFVVLNADGTTEDNSVVRLSESHTHGSPWTQLEAVGKGTAIVVVTYDALQYDLYNTSSASAPVGGNRWSALWPENTGVFVVTVGQATTSISTHMTLNEGMNSTDEKLAGDMVDAEHDVLYYLDDEPGYYYTFAPEGVSAVSVASPSFTGNRANYSGFDATSQKVMRKDDGSYTLLLSQGRNIVRLTDANGNSEYQVLTAKPCSRTITNITHPGEETAHPGDKINIQYTGLFHPANKMAAVYNNSAYIAYNGIEGGESLYESANQYNFAATSSAQLYGIQIPEDINVDETPEFTATDGVICVIGYGAAFGSHRNIDPEQGLSASMNAIQHKSYMGALPPFTLALQPAELYSVVFRGLPEGAVVTFTDSKGKERTPQGDYTWKVLPGAYSYTIEAEGYVTLSNTLSVVDGGPQTIYVKPNMTKTDDVWNGTVKEPETVTESESGDADGEFAGMAGYYKITSAEELAWVAQQVNGGNNGINAVQVNDINLTGGNWTPIGNNSKKYQGTFCGNGHTVSGLTIDSESNYQGLFGSTDGAEIRSLHVEGNVTFGKDQSSAAYCGGIVGAATNTRLFDLHFKGSVSVGSRELENPNVNNQNSNVGGIVGYVNANTTIEQCSNEGSIMGGANVGGIVGNVNANTSGISNCWNTGLVSGIATTGGIVGKLSATGIVVENVYNYGENVEMRSYKSWSSTLSQNSRGAITGTTSSNNLNNVSNAFASVLFQQDSKTTEKEPATFTNGEVAYLLGQQSSCWGQQFGTEALPTFSDYKVMQNTQYSFGDYYSVNNQNDYTAYSVLFEDKAEPLLPNDANSLLAANFSFNRELIVGNVATFVLPVALPTEALNGSVYQMSSVSGTKIYFEQAETETLLPNMPYLIEPDADGQMLRSKLQNVQIVPLAESPSYSLTETTIGNVNHFGTYTTQVFTSGNSNTYYGYSEGKFTKASVATLRPFRTMFAVEGDAAAKPTSFDIVLDGDATDIAEMKDGKIKMKDSMYDLQGRKVQRSAHRPSIIIVNGKKTIVK